MNNTVLMDGTVVYYVVRVNGVDKSQKRETKLMAEMDIQNLPPEEQALAEVVPVTADGRQLLLEA